MPNWCDNELVVTGPDVEVERFVSEVRFTNEKGAVEPLSFSMHVPEPPDLDMGGSAEDVKKPNNWYRWRCENWGTKWDACFDLLVERHGIERPDAGHVVYRFDTAWVPPEPWLWRVSELFPLLTFDMSSTEPGMSIRLWRVIRNRKNIAFLDLAGARTPDEEYGEVGVFRCMVEHARGHLGALNWQASEVEE